MSNSPIEVLLVEDNPGDVDLTKEALQEGKILNALRVVTNGEDALDFLHRREPYATAPRPDLILLDLNLPRRSGLEVLAEIKADPLLKRIPVVILTSSAADTDIVRSYDSHANCFITKPVDFEQFMRVVRSIEEFWVTVVRLPRK